MQVDDAFANWLAGFIDGEGCFEIRVPTNGSGILPAFALQLRQDDVEVLREIARRTGIGRVYLGGSSRSGQKPSARWSVHRRSDVLRLVELLDAHPLRAKKRRDFEIWRAAVRYRAAARPRSRSAIWQMEQYQRRLTAIRDYESPPEAEVAEPEFEQLTIDDVLALDDKVGRA